MLSDDERRARNREYNRKWRINNKEKVKGQQAAYRERHKEVILARNRSWVSENKERNSQQKREHYMRNKERYDAKSAEYAKTHAGWKASHCAKRRAKKKQAMPVWAKDGYMKIFYKLAKLESKRTGKRVEVDHIVPLQHDLVCGLHCEDNLQLLFAADNYAKSNKFDV